MWLTLVKNHIYILGQTWQISFSYLYSYNMEGIGLNRIESS